MFWSSSSLPLGTKTYSYLEILVPTLVVPSKYVLPEQSAGDIYADIVQ